MDLPCAGLRPRPRFRFAIIKAVNAEMGLNTFNPHGPMDRGLLTVPPFIPSFFSLLQLL